MNDRPLPQPKYALPVRLQKPNATTLQELIVGLRERSATSIHVLDIRGRDYSVTYEALLDTALAIAEGLKQNGVVPGGVVAAIDRTSIELVASILGIILAGAIPTVLPPIGLGKRQYYLSSTCRALQSCGALVVIASKKATEALTDVLPANCKLLAVTDLCRSVPAVPHRPLPQSTCLVQFSSGTTIEPKPIALTHAQVLANLRAIEMAIAPDVNSDQPYKVVSWLPLYHDMGLIGGLFHSLYIGAELFLIPTDCFVARPSLWLEVMSATGAQISGGPCFAYQLCLKQLADEQLTQLDLSHWTAALVGADVVQAATLRNFAERLRSTGFRELAFRTGYGLAEATLAVTLTKRDQGIKTIHVDPHSLSVNGRVQQAQDGQEFVSVGVALAGVEIELRDEHGATVSEDHLGQIFVRGPSVMSGYVSKAAGNENPFDRGWLSTGDTGFLHDQQLYVYGRIKDIIILNGRNHEPQHIEATLQAIIGLRGNRIAAFSVPESLKAGEQLWVAAEIVSVNQGPLQALAEEVWRCVVRETTLVPDRVLLLSPGDVLLTTSGKIRRQATREAILSGRVKPRAEYSRFNLPLRP